MSDRALKSALNRLSYSELLDLSENDTAPWAVYIEFITRIALEGAVPAWSRFQERSYLATDYERTLASVRNVLNVKKGVGLEQEIPRLLSLDSLAPHFAVAGEREMYLGSIYFGLGEFQSAIQWFAKAGEVYRANDLWGSEGFALEGICQAARALNRTELMRSSVQRLEALWRQHQSPSVLFLARMARMRIREDEGRFAAALKDCETVVALAEELGKFSHLLVYIFSSFYYGIRSGQVERTQHWEDRLRTYTEDPRFSTPYANFLLKIHRESIHSEKELEVLEREIPRNYPAPQIFACCYYVLFERALGLGFHNFLVKHSRRAMKMVRERKLQSRVADFRIYEVFGLVGSGNRKAAKKIYHQIVADRAAQGLPEDSRLRQIAHIFLERDQLLHRPPTIEFFPNNFKIKIQDQMIIMDHQPTVWRALESFGTVGRDLSEDVFFQHCFGKGFIKDRHGSRLRSLLHRIRSLSAMVQLEWRDGRVVLKNPMQIVPERVSSAKGRRQKILKLLDASPTPLPIRDLVPHFALTRRTLQMDLEELVRTRKIESVGSGRGRIYKMP